MAATQNRDMGSGSIPKLLAQLALPAVVAQVVNLLYNIVDRIYIGHMPEVGASALTGVGILNCHHVDGIYPLYHQRYVQTFCEACRN